MNPSDGQSGTQAPATHTVVSDDTLYGIAQANGISLEALEQANPQISNYDLIHPGDVINLPGSNSAAPTTAASSAGDSSYTVNPGDTLSGIATSHGESLNQVEQDNPQIANPGLIHPGEIVNLQQAAVGPASGGTQTSDSSGDSSQTTTIAPVSTTTTSTTDSQQQSASSPGSTGGDGTTSTTNQTPQGSAPAGGSTGGGSSGDSNTPAGGAVAGAGSGPILEQYPTATQGFLVNGPKDTGSGQIYGQVMQDTSSGSFPSSSSYPFASPGSGGAAGAAEKQIEGWADANGSPAPDVAKGVFEVDTRPSTDPLKIDDKK